MIPKSGYRFSEKIMLQQWAEAWWFEEKSSRFSASPACRRCERTGGCA